MSPLIMLVFIALLGNNGLAARLDVAELAEVRAGSIRYVMFTPTETIQPNGAVYGPVAVVATSAPGQETNRVADAFTARLSSNHAPGYVDEEQFIFHMYRPETFKSVLCHFDVARGSFTAYDVPARFIGAITVFHNRIYYSTEHFDDNIHVVDLAASTDGPPVGRPLTGSGQIATNTDFWIVDGDLVVTAGGDFGRPYRVTGDGLEPAPGVQVSDETRQGFWLRGIINPEVIPEPEEPERLW